LEGSRVFVVGGDQLVAQATVRLAQLAGAKYVYISGPKCIQDALQKCTAFVLDDDPSGWPQEVYGSMDVIIDYQFPARFEEVTKTMAPKSRLVCCTPDNWNRRQENDLWSDLHHFTECLLLSSIKRATLFDFQESYKTNKYKLKEDLQFLLTALTRRHIRPQIDRYVMLGDVPKVYQELRKTPPTGSIVCEPWRE
jgi:NADPH:quinone reductase-like Zn-dependent oxidoreductase